VCLMKALELNRRDSWSSHTVAHVMEMQGRHDDGLKFLDSTVNDWQVCLGLVVSAVVTYVTLALDDDDDDEAHWFSFKFS